jgi:hypothetical protein
MKSFRSFLFCLVLALIFFASGCQTARQKAVESITAEELRVHLNFLAADEFQGRNTPSQELKIASRYIANTVESYGLKPLMEDGRYFQEIPLQVKTVDPSKTFMRLKSGSKYKSFFFPEDFGISGRTLENAAISGDVLFAGFGFSSPGSGWDDLENLDLAGNVVVIIDPELPDDHKLMTEANRRLLRRRSRIIGERGAAAVLTVISGDREREFNEKGYSFDDSPRCSLAEKLETAWMASSGQPYVQAEIRQAMASEILGISRDQLQYMFETIKRGEPVPGRILRRKKIDISVNTTKTSDRTYNVVAWLEGTDQKLKEEYVLLGSHHDHLGTREGKIFNGADDNGSGTVAMLEIAQALTFARPKRSVVLVWHTGEEKGLWGSRYFVQHSPVPVEKMSAELNMDMISRNDPDHLYLIGSKKLSSELDLLINAVNDKNFGFDLDYTYEDPRHPDNFFFRSDQYPYIQYGIPAVWFFCGTTEDYHRETDTVDRADFGKMEKVARLAYLTAMAVGNIQGLLRLDLHPEITSRGKQNLEISWR